MEEAPIGAVASCQVCGAPLTTPKKYQIHKNDQGFSLGGKPYVLHPLPDDVEGHACHKCYQANMKAKKRASLGDGPVDGEHIAPMPKKPRIAANRGAHLAHDAIQLSHFALTNLAALVISSCTTCHGQWLHISEQTLAPDHCEFTFQCAQGHSAKWTSNTTSHDTTAHIKDPNYVEDGENAEEDQVEN